MKKKRTTPDLAVVRRVWGAECEREARKLIDACHHAFTCARGYSTPQGVEVALTPEDSTTAPWYLRRVMVPGKHWALELDEAGVDDIALMLGEWPPAWRVPPVAPHLADSSVTAYVRKGGTPARRRRGVLELFARADDVPQTPHARARAVTTFREHFADISQLLATLRGDDDPDETPAPKPNEVTIKIDDGPAAEVIGTDPEAASTDPDAVQAAAPEQARTPTAQDRIDCMASTIGDLIETLFAEGFAPRHAVALVRAAAAQACDCYDAAPGRWLVSYAGDDLVVMAPSSAQAIEVFAASFGYPSAESMTALLDGEVSVEALREGKP